MKRRSRAAYAAAIAGRSEVEDSLSGARTKGRGMGFGERSLLFSPLDIWVECGATLFLAMGWLCFPDFHRPYTGSLLQVKRTSGSYKVACYRFVSKQHNTCYRFVSKRRCKLLPFHLNVSSLFHRCFWKSDTQKPVGLASMMFAHGRICTAAPDSAIRNSGCRFTIFRIASEAFTLKLRSSA